MNNREGESKNEREEISRVRIEQSQSPDYVEGQVTPQRSLLDMYGNCRRVFREKKSRNRRGGKSKACVGQLQILDRVVGQASSYQERSPTGHKRKMKCLTKCSGKERELSASEAAQYGMYYQKICYLARQRCRVWLGGWKGKKMEEGGKACLNMWEEWKILLADQKFQSLWDQWWMALSYIRACTIIMMQQDAIVEPPGSSD